MSIKRNLYYNLLYQILVLVIPFIVTPYVSRVLGVDGIGIYSYTNSIAHYFMIFILLGLNNYGNRTIASVRDDKNLLSKEFWNIYSMQFITAIIGLAIYIVSVCLSEYEYKNIQCIQTLLVLSAAIDINWFYFGLEQFRVTVIRNAVIKVITTICIFIFVKEQKNIDIYTLILALGTFLSQVVLWGQIKKYVVFVKPRKDEILKHIKPNLILFIPVVAVSLYRIMDKIMVGNLSNIIQLGLYESSDKLVILPLTIVTALGVVMLPRMSNLIATKDTNKEKIYIRNSIQFSVFLAIGMTVGLSAIAHRFVPIYYGEDFKVVASLVIGSSPIIIFSTIANIIRTQYLIPHGRDKEYIISVILGAGVNLIVNIFLIGKYGAFGAIIGTVLAEFIVMMYQIICVKQELEFNIYLKDNVIFIFPAVIMLICIKFIESYLTNTILGLGLEVIVGGAVYTVSSIIVMLIFRRSRIIYLIGLIKAKR